MEILLFETVKCGLSEDVMQTWGRGASRSVTGWLEVMDGESRFFKELPLIHTAKSYGGGSQE